MDQKRHMEESVAQILHNFNKTDIQVSKSYLDGGVEMLFPRLERAALSQCDDGEASLSRYGIWANTCRDHIRHAMELLEGGKEQEAMMFLVKAANSLSAFSEIQALFDPDKDNVVATERKFRVIVGDDQEGYIKRALPMLLADLLPSSYELDIEHSRHGPELVEMAKHGIPDLYIFWFNNIIVSTSMPPQERLKEVLQFIAMFKRQFPAPIMIISGHDGDPPLTNELELYADYLIKPPFQQAQIEEGFRRVVGDLVYHGDSSGEMQ